MRGQGGSKMSDAHWKVQGPSIYRFIRVREVQLIWRDMYNCKKWLLVIGAPNSNKLQTGWEWQTLNLNIQFANFSWDSSRSWQQYFGFIIVQTSLKISQTISLGLGLGALRYYEHNLRHYFYVFSEPFAVFIHKSTWTSLHFVCREYCLLCTFQGFNKNQSHPVKCESIRIYLIAYLNFGSCILNLRCSN